MLKQPLMIKLYRSSLATGLAFGLITVLSACEQQAIDKKTSRTTTGNQATPQSSNPTQAGSRVFIDPATGKFVSEPPAGFTPQNDLPGIARDIPGQPDLVETVAPDGTVTIELGDRFNKPLVASVGCKGKITTTHTPSSDKPASKDCKSSTGEKQ